MCILFILDNRLALSGVDKVILAGGFGSYIDPVHAMILGLIPDCALSEVQAVGNAAGDGARMILLDKGKRAEAQWAARWVTYIETAVEPSFQDEFVGAIDIPHASDPLSGPKIVWPNFFSVATLACVAGCSHISTFIAGHTNTGQRTLSISALSRSLDMP